MGRDEQRLGDAIQQARQAKGMTQQQLCEKADLSYSTLTKIERGAIKSPSIFTVASLCRILNISLDELLGTVVQGYNAPHQPNDQKKISRSGIRFLYLDLNGCLVHFYQHAFLEISQDYGVSSGQVESAFWHYNDAANRGNLSLQEFNEAFAKRLGIESIAWQDYYLSAAEPIKEAQDVLRWASEHYKVGLLTNITESLVEGLLAKGTLPDVEYDTIIDSSKVGHIKPELEIYQIAIEQAGVPAEEILFVDDSRANLSAAESLGMKVLWFDDFSAQASAQKIREYLEF